MATMLSIEVVPADPMLAMMPPVAVMVPIEPAQASTSMYESLTASTAVS